MSLTYIRHKSGNGDHMLGSRQRPYGNASAAAKGNKKRARFYLTGKTVAGRGFEVTGLPASRWSKNAGRIAGGAEKKEPGTFQQAAKQAGYFTKGKPFTPLPKTGTNEYKEIKRLQGIIERGERY